METEEVLRGALPPIVAALVLVTIGGVRLLPLAMAIGLYVAYGLVNRTWLPWPHELWSAPNGTQWLVWAVIGVALLTLLEHWRVVSTKVAAALGVAAAAGGVYVMLLKRAEAAKWSAGDALLYIGAGGIAAGLLVLVCRRAVERAPAGIPAAVVFVFVLSLDSLLLVLGAHVAGIAQMCGAVAAAAGAGAGTVLWRRSFTFSLAEGTWLGASHALFVLAGAHLGDLPWPAAICALAAPCAVLLVPQMAHHAVRWTVLAVVAAAVPIGAALWLSWPAPSGY